MAIFPTLKTGAITQYPATLKVSFGPVQSVEFLDGSSHRYCTGPTPLRQWSIRFEHLDAREDAIVMDFLQRHRHGTFSFVDPFSGETIARCGVHGFELLNGVTGEMSQAVGTVIEERP